MTGDDLARASALLALACVWGCTSACTRHADIRDEPDAALLDPDPDLDAGDIPDLDSGVASDAFPPCAERPFGDCQGPVDFPCDFGLWVDTTATSCQELTGCATNGWLEVTMGADGCVESLGMDQPDPEMVACLVAELGAVRCPCGEMVTKHFFGLANDGCSDAGGPSG